MAGEETTKLLRYLVPGPLVPREHAGRYPGARVLWQGLIYEGSETRTLELIIHTLRTRRGEDSNFRMYQVLYRERIY